MPLYIYLSLCLFLFYIYYYFLLSYDDIHLKKTTVLAELCFVHCMRVCAYTCVSLSENCILVACLALLTCDLCDMRDHGAEKSHLSLSASARLLQLQERKQCVLIIRSAFTNVNQMMVYCVNFTESWSDDL